ncbi:hypothetical protein BS297_21470 [Rhodococcus erythropolis]|uniref:Uncharacterized protein n=1 Tax=Rhodococcus erythropolis TaxID=1833 RepID=A0A0C3A7C2_RHOER|nr:hypothetical protein XU06_15565 [Rhodococcus erythropolis]ARE34623.1 hypothetical protein A0W34_15895 [Rhodococcus sp. BH4]ATI32923.1 hypothetical protein CPI83_13420 [Rhodococcus sp. H-CA8f]KAB2583275.1 hypothetical protein BS297_21470 [Rhodococcus erythropolis]KIM16069.1 hypothetical protein QV65_17420 [Rhodococcus erythropolis]
MAENRPSLAFLPLLPRGTFRQAGHMAIIVVSLLVLLVLNVLALAGRTPDTRHDVSPHGDFTL